MKIMERLCVQDFTIEDKQGASFTLKRGEHYTTSANLTSGGEVFVFTRYWFAAPREVFIDKDRRVPA